MIKSIIHFKDVVIYNKHHDKEYFNDKGVIVIERANGMFETVDLKSGEDISHCDYLEVRIPSENPNVTVLFENSFGEDLVIMQRNLDNMSKRKRNKILKK